MNPTVTVDDSLPKLSQRATLAKGQPIGKLMAQALQFPELVSLAAGFVDNATLPCEATTQSLQRLCADEGLLRRALQYDATAGSFELRSTLVEQSRQSSTNWIEDPDRIVLTSGSNQFLHLLSETLLNPGDIVLAAAPTYFVFMGTLRGIGVRVVGVPADDDGLCIDALEEQLDRLKKQGEAPRVKAVYSVTDFDNPAGSTLSLERRQRLLDLVARWRREQGPLMIWSDNAYQLLRYEGEPLPSLTKMVPEAADYVVEIGTFSKSYSPGIRVGWGVVPQGLVPPLLEMKSNMDFGSPHFSQLLLQQVLSSGAFDRHLPFIRDGYRIKLNAMLSALEAQFGETPGVHWRKPKGGLYVWLTLPEHIDTSESGRLWRHATENGVLYVPGHYCFPTEGTPIQKNTIRLSFGVQSPEGIADGVARLAVAVHQLCNS